MRKYIKKIKRRYADGGLRGVVEAAKERSANVERFRDYQKWIDAFETYTDEELEDIAANIDRFSHRPLISIIMPVYNVEEKWLRSAIGSVIRQNYEKWELCIADDNSPSPHIRRVLDEFSAADQRIKVVYRETNGHIAAASNSALEMADGEFCCLMDHDDELAKNALYFVVKEINEHPETDMIYSDEDKIDENGRRSYPSFKPDWSPEVIYSLNLVTHLSVYRTSILKAIGGFQLGTEGSQDYDLALRFYEASSDEKIRHIPRVLYHWRVIPGSVALDPDEKNYAHERARSAIVRHFERKNERVDVVRGFGSLHRVIRQIELKSVKIDMINVDFSDAGRADFFELNAEAKGSEADILCFARRSKQEIDRSSLSELASLALCHDVAVVGPRIIYPEGKIKSNGLIMGINGGVGRAHHGASKHRLGNFFRLQVTLNVAALPIDFFMIRREIFESVGGFDVENFPYQYADVDICLRLIKNGFRNVWTPWAEVVQDERLEFSTDKELEILKQRYSDIFERDPFYNTNLTADSEDLAIAWPPRSSKY